MKKIIGACPHFLVRDVIASGNYYTEKLGFTIPEYWGNPPTFAMPHRDRFIVMLNQVDRLEPSPNGKNDVWDAYFWCKGVDELYQEFLESGADIFHEPVDRELYGNREIGVRDPDGYLLVFAEEINAG